MKEKVKKVKTPLKVGSRNFLSGILALLAIVLFIPVALIAVYYVANYFGFGEPIMAFLESIQVKPYFVEILAKCDAPDSRRFNQIYSLFSVMTFFFLIFVTPKKNKKNSFLYFLYILGTIICIVFLAMYVLFPTVPAAKLLLVLFAFPATPYQEIITKLLSNVQFLTAVVTLLLFAISFMAANTKRKRSNTILKQRYDDLVFQLDNVKLGRYKLKMKPLSLSATHWGLFLVFLCQFAVPVLFTHELVIAFYWKAAVAVVIPLLNCAFYGISKRKAQKLYNAKYASIMEKLENATKELDPLED